jgi:hypothetical protein
MFADVEAIQAPAEPSGSVQAPFAAPAAAPPMPAAAAIPPAAAEQEPAQAAPVEVLAESPANDAMPSQLRLEKKAEQAADAMPGIQSQIASDAAAAPGGPASEMGGVGGAGYAFGGGAAASAPRDGNANLAQKAAEKRERPSAGPMPALGNAPAHPSDVAEGLAERESLARNQVRSEPAAEQQVFRQYARRSLAEFDADARSAPMETACWEPFLLTDAQGRATLQFRLPETTTTYRVLVDGHAQGRIGSYLGRIVVKPETAAGAKSP